MKNKARYFGKFYNIKFGVIQIDKFRVENCNPVIINVCNTRWSMRLNIVINAFLPEKISNLYFNNKIRQNKATPCKLGIWQKGDFCSLKHFLKMLNMTLFKWEKISFFPFKTNITSVFLILFTYLLCMLRRKKYYIFILI